MENLYSYIRARGGHCKSPSVHVFNIAVAKLLFLKMTQFSTLSNCANEDAMFLTIELQTILEDTERVENISESTHTPK